MIKEIREDFAKEAKISNARTLAWERLTDSLYKTGDADATIGLTTIDNLLSTDTSLHWDKISNLHFIKGDIYYGIDSFESAVCEFTISGRPYDMQSPLQLNARAASYIKLKQFDKAKADLIEAAGINSDYYSNLASYYEIIGNKDSAMYYYNTLYLKDTSIYKHCLARILALKNNTAKPVTELKFRSGKTKILLWQGVE